MSKAKVKCQGRNRSGRWSYSSGYPQCTRPATTPAGYCKIHDPEIRKAKDKARQEKWAKVWAEKEAKWNAQAKRQAYLEFCARHFDALESALRDALQTAEFERHGERPWHYAARAVFAAIDAERQKEKNNDKA